MDAPTRSTPAAAPSRSAVRLAGRAAAFIVFLGSAAVMARTLTVEPRTSAADAAVWVCGLALAAVLAGRSWTGLVRRPEAGRGRPADPVLRRGLLLIGGFWAWVTIAAAGSPP